MGNMKMKLSVFTPILASLPLEKALETLHNLGVQQAEFGTGGYSGTAHINPLELLGNSEKIQKVKDMLKKYEIEISAFSCHGNPIHPDKEIAYGFHRDFELTCQLAKEFDVETIITFSGCPGGSPNDKTPNWVTCPWPTEFRDILDYQWNEVLIPYWEKAGEYAKEYGIKKIAFEMHPGFCVYNPETMLGIRKAVGNILGANFDPSHLLWQGIDPVYAIKKLGDAIYHFHAKDTKIDEINTKINGVLDTKSYARETDRAWIFRTVGYGNGGQRWKDIISTLRVEGYDGAISIEHEDSLMSPEEGLRKAITLLKEVMIFEDKEEAWWA